MATEVAAGVDSRAGYTSPPGWHRHQCHKCGCVWEHETIKFGLRRMHTCPSPACGVVLETELGAWPCYAGEAPPQYRHVGRGKSEPVAPGG